MNKKVFFVSALMAMATLFAPSAMAQEQMVKMTTSKEVGSPITLQVNHCNKGVTVDWGDGQLVTYSSPKSGANHVIEGTVKGQVISVMGNHSWYAFSCSDCGITEIDLSGATALRTLFCDHNEISTLSLKGMTKLTDLNCSFNKISKVEFTSYQSTKYADDLASIEYLNLSNNQLEGSYNWVLPTLQQLNVSNNQITSMYANSEALLSIDCSNNVIKGFGFTRCPNLSSIICHNNKIAFMGMTENGVNVQQLVCDNNDLNRIDLSNAEGLVDVSCTNNGMSEMLVDGKAKISSMNVAGNSLTFSMLPTKSKAPAFLNYEPQRPFDMANVNGVLNKDGIPYLPISEKWNEKQLVDLKEYSSLSNGHIDADYRWVSVGADGTETEMTRRRNASGTEDFYAANGRYAFFVPHKKAYVELTSRTYGYVIKSRPIAIGDDLTAIEEVVNDGNGLQVAVAGQALLLTSAQPVVVRIYTSAGKNVWQNVVSGTETVTLPKGVYVVNGHKVIL